MSDKKKKLIVGDFKKALKELVKQVMDEISTTGGVSPTAVPNWVSKNPKGRPDIATKSTGYKLAEKKGENKLVPVGKEKTPDVVKGPSSKGVKKDDLYILHKRRAIAASKKDKKDTEHYDSLIATGEKSLGLKPGTTKSK